MTDEEIQSMLEHGNKSGKPGKGVSFDDFYRLMQKKVRPRPACPCDPDGRERDLRALTAPPLRWRVAAQCGSA